MQAVRGRGGKAEGSHCAFVLKSRDVRFPGKEGQNKKEASAEEAWGHGQRGQQSQMVRFQSGQHSESTEQDGMRTGKGHWNHCVPPQTPVSG